MTIQLKSRVELMRRPILNHTKRGELVYDPFLGSGTTLAAAELTERVCCGMELDPKYVDVIVKRWQQFTGQGGHARRRRTARSTTDQSRSDCGAVGMNRALPPRDRGNRSRSFAMGIPTSQGCASRFRIGRRN